MASSLSTKAIKHFFFKDGASQALFRWLDFRLFVSQQNSKLASIENSNKTTLSATDYLDAWQQQVSVAAPSIAILRIFSFIAMVIGFTTMAGVLNVNQHALINVWIPLALFAFLPFLLTLSSVYFSLLSSAKQNLQHHPILSWLIHKLKLERFLPYKNLLLPWLFWQLQTAAILFTTSALVSFFMLATFQDYRFGWSSTLITDNASMTQLMSVISWPWHWLLEAPSAELISQTRFSSPMEILPVAANDVWWMTLVIAIIVYGLLPRLFLALFLRRQLIKQLRGNIQHSGVLEQFIVAQKHQASRNPVRSNNDWRNTDEVSLPEPAINLISWQQPQLQFTVLKNLGTADWLDDENWLKSAASHNDKPAWIVVEPSQIPTGELADCVDLLQQHNPSVSLVLYPIDKEEPRFEQQKKSWQFFAQRHQIDLKEGIDRV
ncbi:MAG TPA: DUF2868 domain-containing protein [Methylophaga aminisulfidivorans]|uniref:DUF2868 domain-containing protein n=3 Tax=root TaxID=1 RepID=A0A7C1VQJ9_9GAMM|nr:DUF2868 domain-containing protein [Methylophaga aminisulfidivorans]